MRLTASPGILYGIGVGPGDPELMTVKAVRLLRELPTIAVPVAQNEGESYALDIVAGLLSPEQRLLKLHFPMGAGAARRTVARQAAAEAIAGELRAGQSVAFLTEGDPLLYSTFGHLLRHLPPDLPIEVVPGVSAVTAAAAQGLLPLVQGEERMAILPANLERTGELRSTLRAFDTVVLLKVAPVLEPLLDLLEELGLAAHAYLVERASHRSARVVRDLRSLRGQAVHYLSLVIVHARGSEHED